MKTLLLILVFVVCGFGQEVAAPSKLTNKDVIKLVETELPESVIVSKIKTSKTAFQTDVESLKALKEAKVPAAVISAMIDKSAEKNPEKKPVTSTTESPEYGNISEIKDATKVYISTTEIKARELIVKELAKYSRFTLVDTIEDADFLLSYKSRRNKTGVSVIGSTIIRNNILVGGLYAITRGAIDEQKRRRPRVVWSTISVQDYGGIVSKESPNYGGITFNPYPAKNAIKQFIKEFKKLRGEKD